MAGVVVDPAVRRIFFNGTVSDPVGKKKIKNL
jgi:hypothetical protein